jgi:hypothetical protein
MPTKVEARLRQDAVEWVRRELGFSPGAQQAGVPSIGIRRGMLNCTRQWGKSTIAAAKAIHKAFTDQRRRRPRRIAATGLG